MKLKITRNTFIKGVGAQAGDTVEVDDDTARQLVEARKAEPAPEGKKPAATKAGTIESRDPKPAKRR
jgi:hypothetical protein